MEELLRQRIAQLHALAPDSIGDRLGFTVVSAQADSCVLRCRTESWMRNALGTLHGGISATILDQAMGAFAFCLLPGEGIAPTIELQTVYHRPLMAGEDVLARVFVTAKTHTLLHFRGELYAAGTPEKLCVSGSGMYYFKPFPKKADEKNSL